ncbi:DUF11 domain-containing protein, partial [Algoriphagus boseongensis]
METLSNYQFSSRTPEGGFLKWGELAKSNLLGLSFVLLFLFSFFPKGFSQNTSPVVIPSGGIGIEGDLVSNSPTVGIGDWFPGPAGAGGHVFSSSGVPLNVETSFWVKDGYKGTTLPQELVFTSGTKSSDDPSSWIWGASDAGGKGDIGNAFLHIGTAANNDTWLVVASDRLATNGTSYLEFEFFQNTITRNTNNNRFTGTRSINDILVAVSYENGGSAVDIKFYLWNGSSYIQTTSSNAFGFVNTSISQTPVGAFGNSSYQPLQFVEAALNITEILGALTDPCLGIKVKTMMVKTRSSSSLTAAADDFIDPIQVKINFGTAEVTYDSNLFCGPNTTVPAKITGVTGGTFTSNSNNLKIDAQSGEINLATSLPGSYVVKYSFTTKNCNKFIEIPVTIPSKAPAPTNQTFDYCQNSGDKLLSVTPASGYTIKWYDQNDNPLSGAPTISTLSAGTFTYKISQTKTGECESAKATVTVNVGTCSLALVKTATNGPSGENCLDPTLNPTINYSFVLTNTGAYPLTDVQISDPLFQAPNAVVALTLGANGNGNAILDVNESWTYTASYTITEQDIENGKVENQATASGKANGTTVSDLSGTAANNDTKTVVVVCQTKALTLAKEATSGDPYDAVGDVVAYRYVITNSGNVTLNGPFSVTDNKISSIANVNGPLAPGASVTATGSYTISQSDLDAGSVTNLATASGNGVTSNQAQETVNAVQTANLELTKTSTTSPNSYDAVGDVLTYNLIVKNTGNVTLSNIVVSDPVATVVGSPIASLAPGASATATASYTVTQSDVDAGSFTNTATASTTYNNTPVRDTDSETVNAVQTANLELTKTSTTSPNSYDAVGDVLTYNLIVKNTGNVTLSNIVVSDPVATVVGSPIASLAPGASATATASYTVTQSDVDAGSFTNTATASTTYNNTPVRDTDSETVNAVQT